jgi:cytochrome c-type biogenesis protein CcmH
MIRVLFSSVLVSLTMAIVSMNAVAVIETYEFSTPELELRYKALSQELRCPKCQNQNIADSNAPISRDLRAIVHEQLEAGATDDQIITYLVDRYGEFVRYRPGVDGNTFWLWSAPIILFLMAFAVVWLQIRGDRDVTTVESNAERARELREKYDGK